MRARAVVYDDSGRLRAPWRLAAFAAAAVVAQPLAQWLILGPANAAAGALGGPFDTGPLVTAVALLAAHAFVLRVLEKRPWSDVRLGRGSWRAGALGLGAAGGALAIGLPVALLLAVGWMREVPWAPGSWWGIALRLTPFFLVAALWEELAFRGYLFSAVEEMGGTRAAVAVTSLLFGVAHVQNPGASLVPVAIVTLAGAFLGAIMLATRSLGAAWLAHAAFNWTQSVAYHAPVSGVADATPDYRLLETGPDWVTGGTWGPEGGVAALGGMVVALLVLNRFTTRPLRREERTT